VIAANAKTIPNVRPRSPWSEGAPHEHHVADDAEERHGDTQGPGVAGVLQLDAATPAARKADRCIVMQIRVKEIEGGRSPRST
jgi:hypothetical protein